MHAINLDHQCEFPGCKTTVVLDGNMKNRRDICFAKDAGSISYPGLPGHIKTGCVASPAYKSRYCQNHQARSCEATNSEKEQHIYRMSIWHSYVCSYIVTHVH